MTKIWFFASFFIISAHLSFAQYWTQYPDFPGPARDDAASFRLQGDFYIGTGLTPWFAATGDVYSINPFTQAWTAVAALPSGAERQYACGFASLTHGYIFGGLNDTNYLNDLWRYDPSLNQWTQVASLPARGRSGSISFVVQDTTYILGGQTTDSAAIPEVWAYSMVHDTWTKKPDLPFSSWRGCSACQNGRCYAFFGKDYTGKINDSLYTFNPAIGPSTLHAVDTFPGNGRIYASMAMTPEVYVLAGMDSNGTFYNDLWHYPISGSGWVKRDSIPGLPRRGGAALCSFAHGIFYTTGVLETGQRTKESWFYFVPIGIEEDENEHAISVYPNPTSDKIFLKNIALENLEKPTVQILNSAGQVVARPIILTHGIDVQELPSGVYFILIELDGESREIRFVKN